MRQLKRTTLYFFGDSIFFGQGVSPHKTWVTRLSQRVSDAFAGVCELVVQNPSVNGNTTRLALERMAYDVQAHRPDVLVVQFGMNDCNVWQTDSGRPRVSSAAFAANLAEIIERGRKFGDKRGDPRCQSLDDKGPFRAAKCGPYVRRGQPELQCDHKTGCC